MTSASPRALPPIRSERADDPDFADRLDAFVFALGARIDEFQDLEADGQHADLGARAGTFGEECRELGYALLTDAAHDVARACQERSPDAVRKSLIDLTELSKRVRSGHRGAA